MRDEMSLEQIISSMMQQNEQNTLVDQSEFYQVLMQKVPENNGKIDT